MFAARPSPYAVRSEIATYRTSKMSAGGCLFGWARLPWAGVVDLGDRTVKMGWAGDIGCAIVILVGSVCLAIIGPGLLLGAMLILDSHRTVFERVASSDKWREARVQFDDAGAVSSFSRLVFVKHRWNFSDEPLLSCRAFWAEGEEAVHLHWLDNHTLLIQHAFPPKDVQAVANHCGNVRIVVQSIQSSSSKP